MTTIEEATKLLKMSDQAIWLKGLEKEQKEATEMAIKSLEAWEKIKKEIDDSILICRKDAQNNTWCDGELAGFLQSKDIINRNLSEVNE